MAWANRNAFMWFLRGVVPLIYVVGILGVAGAAAASITSEHEEDTWVSLTATDLTGREIVFAKMVGAMKRGLMFGGVIVFLAILGAFVGSISPLSIPPADSGNGGLRLRRRGARALDLASTPLHLASPVPDHGMPAAHQRLRPRACSICCPDSGLLPSSGQDSRLTRSSKLVLDSQFIEQLPVAQWPRSWRFQPWMTASSGKPSSAC